MKFEVVVPCSTANLGPGFDSLGMALNQFLKLRFSPSSQLSIEVQGVDVDSIPSDESNLVVRVMEAAFALQGQSLPAFHLVMENEIPLTRGLGSSAAAVIGGLVAANHYLGSPWNKKQLLQLATEWEGHPDNVGASLYGGVVIGAWDGKTASILPCDAPPLPVLVAIPQYPLSTKKARAALPASYSREDAVFTSSYGNLLTAVFLKERWDLLATAMQDRFHQPYREALVPGLAQILHRSTDEGALGVALSGAGPTVLAFVDDIDRLTAFWKRIFQEENMAVSFQELQPHPVGAELRLTADVKHSTFVGNR